MTSASDEQTAQPAVLTGGCHCGEVRFSVTGQVLGTGACHCTDCCKLAGGSYNALVIVRQGAITVTAGEPRRYTITAASGEPIVRTFCRTCGTPLWTAPGHAPIEVIKLGALDDQTGLEPRMHLYTSSAPAWHQFTPGAPCFEQMPPSRRRSQG